MVADKLEFSDTFRPVPLPQIPATILARMGAMAELEKLLAIVWRGPIVAQGPMGVRRDPIRDEESARAGLFCCDAYLAADRPDLAQKMAEKISSKGRGPAFSLLALTSNGTRTAGRHRLLRCRPACRAVVGDSPCQSGPARAWERIDDVLERYREKELNRAKAEGMPINLNGGYEFLQRELNQTRAYEVELQIEQGRLDDAAKTASRLDRPTSRPFGSIFRRIFARGDVAKQADAIDRAKQAARSLAKPSSPQYRAVHSRRAWCST